MKITKITPIFCDGIWRVFSFVKVETDEGLTGFGECTDSANALGTAGCIKDMESLLIGKDPREVNKLHLEMTKRNQQNPGGVAQKAIAVVETALWDIKGKAANMPLYELFGGAVRDKIRVYWSHCGTYRARYPELYPNSPRLKTYEDIYNLGQEVVQRGYTAFKTNMVVPGEPSRVLANPEQNVDVSILNAIDKLISTFRKAVGDKADILLDLNFNFKTAGYIQVAKVVEPYNLMWLEMDMYDPVGLLQVKNSYNVPLNSGECLYTMKQYEPYLRQHAFDYCMIDLRWNGYIESRRVAALADMYEIMAAPHNYVSHLSTFMCSHLCATIPNFKIMETDYDSVPWRDEITTDVPEIKDGYMLLPKKPGIGTELNEKAIAKHPWPK
jgi:L-alanine-DL-glutamate epimerase-like enolase superfamily enzyme